MAEYNVKAPVRTGMSGAIRRSTGTIPAKSRPKTLSNPILKYQAGSGVRATKVGTAPPFDIMAVRSAYLVDSYIHQGLDKYIETIFDNGWDLKGGKETTAYIRKRLQLFRYTSGQDWDITFRTLVSDFVKYGNCFLVKVRFTTDNPIPGMYFQPGTKPVGAYFNIPAFQMTPVLSPEGEVIKWQQRVKQETREFDPKDILHFTYDKEAGGIWGIPPVVTVIEDIRALRQMEENVIKLIYKYLNPMIHQTVPDITGTGEGRQEDIDDVVNAYRTSAPDGFIITPPGHTIKVIGAESQAIRAEGYLQMFKARVLTGLGVSNMDIGDISGEISQGAADHLAAQTHKRAGAYQSMLSSYITSYIFDELLIEAGYDPINNPDDRVVLEWPTLDTDDLIKMQTHLMNLWTMNGITSEELREGLGFKGKMDWGEGYVSKVQIPQAIASRFGVNILTDKSPDLPQSDTKGRAPRKDRKDTTGKAGLNITTPTNKKGGSAITLSYPEDRVRELSDRVISRLGDIREGKLTPESMRKELFYDLTGDEAWINNFCNQIIELAAKKPRDIGAINVRSKLLSEHSALTRMLVEEGVQCNVSED